MRTIFLLLAVIGACVGCSGSQGGLEQGSVPDYEIVGEQEEDTPNLQMKTIDVSTKFIKETELRRIAEDIRDDNTDQDALDIEFYRDKRGQSEGQDRSKITGAALVANSEEAAHRIFDAPMFTAADREKIMSENDGMVVISFAQIGKELDQDLQEMERELDQEMEQDMQEAEKEMQEMEKELDQEMQEMEKKMDRGMPEPPKFPDQ
jgi:hypothetical protein